MSESLCSHNCASSKSHLCCPDGIMSFSSDTSTPGLYTLSLHDALPICDERADQCGEVDRGAEESLQVVQRVEQQSDDQGEDRKSTRLNSSHVATSYAVFCLKKKKNFAEHANTRQCRPIKKITENIRVRP